MFAAVLDTCVLWPSLQRDVVLSLAVEGLYRPLWSTAVLAELEEHEARKLVARGRTAGAAEAAARHLVDEMRRAFDDACVEGWEPLDGAYGLPDPDDEHLVAAAVVGGAGAIVTSNLRDLPPDLLPDQIAVRTPQDFVRETVEISPEVALRAVTRIAARYRNPARTADEVLAVLASRYGMGAAADLIRGRAVRV